MADQDHPPDTGAFCCVSLPPQGGGPLARLARSLSGIKSGGGRGADRPSDDAVERALRAATCALSCDAAAKENDSDDARTSPDKPEPVGSPSCRLVRAGSSSNNSGSTTATTVETFAFAQAGLALRPVIANLISHVPLARAPPSLSPSTLARVVPYSYVSPRAFCAISGRIDNARDLQAAAAAAAPGARRGRRPDALPSPSSAPPSFEAARDLALAEAVAGLALTPPPPGAVGASSASSHNSSNSTRARSAAALAGVRRAVQAGEAAAAAVLALVEDALASGGGSSPSSSSIESLTLALSEIQGSFALVLHDAERGFTLAARDASGEEELWFSLAPDSGSVLFASPRPLSLGPPLLLQQQGDWHAVPPGHFVVCGWGRQHQQQQQPRMYQYALAPDELSARASAAADGREHAPRSFKASGGIALSVFAADADAADASPTAAAAAPLSPSRSILDDFPFYE